MSGRSSRKNKKLSNMQKIVTSVAIIFLIVFLASLSMKNWGKSEDKKDFNEVNNSIEEHLSEQVEEASGIHIDLGHDMYITEIGKYTGVYMEDGSDEMVSDIMMIVVKNEGEKAIQYAEITMPVGDREASFKLTTLLPGRTIVLLEQNCMKYEEEDCAVAEAKNVAIFKEEISLYENRLKIQKLDGAMNITNISEEDIPGDITIYYKNNVSDLLYGGITYRVKIEGGLKEDEIRQVMTGHLTEQKSEIMFVTIGQ